MLVLLCAAVAAVIGAILGAGLVPAVGLSAAILGDRVGSYETMLAITQGYGGASHVIAALLGGGLLWAFAVSLIAQVYLRGLVMLHQRASEGLDAESHRRRADAVGRRGAATRLGLGRAGPRGRHAGTQPGTYVVHGAVAGEPCPGDSR